ncbi:unnamed protein product [Darwinula stevensoni]|uniref:LIM zinc-binding domain-containing protein n=1 Tax=Darwinula stevensoni TaxID=69355 RepID=A0A7R8X7E2_9CRUS|nr:unnamed protein product [Darwinula stevensoni]CAG0883165.1 unnamed protein product [Darwinula stevensoni]
MKELCSGPDYLCELLFSIFSHEPFAQRHSGKENLFDGERRARAFRESSRVSESLAVRNDGPDAFLASGDNGVLSPGEEFIPTRSKKTSMVGKPAYNPLQFIQVGPAKLYKSAQEQLEQAEKIKQKRTEVRKEEEEDWQANLDNWKSCRRKRVEDVIERVVEVKKLEEESEWANANRKSKTFSEMMQERRCRFVDLTRCRRRGRSARGRKVGLSLSLYTDADDRDLSDLGLNSEKSEKNGEEDLSGSFSSGRHGSDWTDDDGEAKKSVWADDVDPRGEPRSETRSDPVQISFGCYTRYSSQSSDSNGSVTSESFASVVQRSADVYSSDSLTAIRRKSEGAVPTRPDAVRHTRKSDLSDKFRDRLSVFEQSAEAEATPKPAPARGSKDFGKKLNAFQEVGKMASPSRPPEKKASVDVTPRVPVKEKVASIDRRDSREVPRAPREKVNLYEKSQSQSDLSGKSRGQSEPVEEAPPIRLSPAKSLPQLNQEEPDSEEEREADEFVFEARLAKASSQTFSKSVMDLSQRGAAEAVVIPVHSVYRAPSTPFLNVDLKRQEEVEEEIVPTLKKSLAPSVSFLALAGLHEGTPPPTNTESAELEHSQVPPSMMEKDDAQELEASPSDSLDDTFYHSELTPHDAEELLTGKKREPQAHSPIGGTNSDSGVESSELCPEDRRMLEHDDLCMEDEEKQMENDEDDSTPQPLELEQRILMQLEASDNFGSSHHQIREDGPVSILDFDPFALPAAKEPPREKPPPPPPVEEIPLLETRKNFEPILRDSTKNLKKSLWKRRSDFLGLSDSMEPEEPELLVSPPPDMDELLRAERALEERQRQLLSRSISSRTEEQSNTSFSSISSPSQTLPDGMDDDEEELIRQEREIIESLEREERLKNIGIQLPNLEEDERIRRLEEQRQDMEEERQRKLEERYAAQSPSEQTLNTTECMPEVMNEVHVRETDRLTRRPRPVSFSFSTSSCPPPFSSSSSSPRVKVQYGKPLYSKVTSPAHDSPKPKKFSESKELYRNPAFAMEEQETEIVRPTQNKEMSTQSYQSQSQPSPPRQRPKDAPPPPPPSSEAEQRRITEHQEKSLRSSTSTPAVSSHPKGYQHMNGDSWRNQSLGPPPTDSAMPKVTQTVQHKRTRSPIYENLPSPGSKGPESPKSSSGCSPPMLSVSGKKKCSHCSKELGRGAAMIIESLRLFYHLQCFRCCVCETPLGNGTTGADVRVRHNRLHCHNCYSNDQGVKFSKV